MINTRYQQCVASYKWQLDDETRHALLAQKRLEDFGGKLGEFPVIKGQYAYRIKMPLIKRLGDMNLYSEKLALIRARNRKDKLITIGDYKTADFFNQVMFEEAVHVRIGLRWVNFLLNGNKDDINNLNKQTARNRENIGFILLQRYGARKLGLSDAYRK